MNSATHYDVAIIGAGPSGMAAAITAANRGLSVVVLDEQPEPGGQIYRGIERVAATRPRHLEWLGPDYHPESCDLAKINEGLKKLGK